jgi:hypothetical protein
VITIAVLTALPKRTPLWTTDLPRLPGRRTPARLSASLVRVRPPSEADRCWRHFAGWESGAGAVGVDSGHGAPVPVPVPASGRTVSGGAMPSSGARAEPRARAKAEATGVTDGRRRAPNGRRRIEDAQTESKGQEVERTVPLRCGKWRGRHLTWSSMVSPAGIGRLHRRPELYVPPGDRDRTECLHR